MNITLSVDEQVADRARQVAQAMGKSLNQMVREYLERLAGQAQLEAELQAYRQSIAESPGRLNGWKFDRDEINQRRQCAASSTSMCWCTPTKAPTT